MAIGVHYRFLGAASEDCVVPGNQCSCPHLPSQKCATDKFTNMLVTRGGSRGGRRGLEPRSDFKLPNFLKIEITGFCLPTSLHKSNFHTSHAHYTHHTQNWSVEPLSDFRLDPPLQVTGVILHSETVYKYPFWHQYFHLSSIWRFRHFYIIVHHHHSSS